MSQGKTTTNAGVMLLRLEDFGLTLASLTKLGSRSVLVRGHLRSFRPERLFRLPPHERATRIRDWYERRAKEAARRWPAPEFSILRGSGRPYGIEGELPACRVPDLLRLRSLEHVWIEAIEGRRRKAPKVDVRWFTVYAQFVIQIEGKTSGRQTVEDRFVAVRATTFDEAVKKLKPEFRRYAIPYLNSDGEMVRWALERIVDVYDTGEREIDGEPVEVFSRLRERRLRPEFAWKPKGRC